MFLYYSFHLAHCFVYRLTRVSVPSKRAPLHVPQPQDLSSLALESAPQNSPLAIPTMLEALNVLVVDVSSE